MAFVSSRVDAQTRLLMCCLGNMHAVFINMINCGEIGKRVWHLEKSTENDRLGNGVGL